MGERNLRSRAPKAPVNTSEPAALGLQTPESVSSAESGAADTNGFSNMTPSKQTKAPQSNRKRITLRTGSAQARKKQKRDEVYDDPDAVLANFDSPLFKDNVNIKNILLHPRAREILGDSANEYMKLSSDTLSTAVAAFKEDGACGHFAPEWLSEARAATEFRAAGQTAEYEEYVFRELWQTERETLSDDDEEVPEQRQNREDEKDVDFNEPPGDETKIISAVVSEVGATKNDDKPQDEMEVDSTQQDETEVEAPHPSPATQNPSEIPSESTEAMDT